MSLKALLSCAIIALALPSLAQAADHVVTQEKKKFSERKLKIAIGDTVTFINNDDHTHNVHSATEGHAFDLGAQHPGDQHTVTLDTPGEVKIRCAIHPRMRMTVIVE